jgi:GrpB-like predicted nucleotidyltransferase (UPF0157 family)
MQHRTPGTPSRYTFTDYSPAWPTEFEREAEKLRALLGEELLHTHHIGSTSVPGLAAKPIIDLLPIVRDIGQMDAAAERFGAAGYKIWGEYGIPGRRFFTKDRDGLRTHNLHFFQAGFPEIERHLSFVAYLRAHPAICDEYAALKREAFARHPADVNAYNDYKDGWIKRIEKLALASWPPRK